MKFIIFLVYLIPSLSHAAIQLDKTKISQILEKADKLYRSNSAFLELEMQVITPDWERSMEIEMWSKGEDKTLAVILSPKKDKGMATLRIKKDLWNYLPKINKIIKVPPSMMMGSWMGSDFTNDDMVKESSYEDDYNVLSANEVDKEFQISISPKESTVSEYGKIEIRILKDSLILLNQKFFNERNELVREMKFLDIKEMGGKRIPTKIELINMKKIGNKTIVKYKKAKFNIEIQNSKFSKKNLQKVRK